MSGKMSRKEIILAQIEAKYKNIANFARETGIPDSSIRSIKNRPDDSIDNMGVGQFVRICKDLNLDAYDLIDGKMSIRPNEQKEAVLDAYRRHPIDLDKVTEDDLALLEAIQQLPESQKPLLLSFLQGISEPPT